MAFEEDEISALTQLKKHFMNAQFQQKLDLIQQHALFIFQNNWGKLGQIKLHLKGTSFQLKVWETL
ncbi:cysteine methyltransferase, partial [Acinetobacter baumannii]